MVFSIILATGCFPHPTEFVVALGRRAPVPSSSCGHDRKGSFQPYRARGKLAL